IPQESKVIELGCGKGAFARHAAVKLKDYYGIDIDDASIAEAKSMSTHEFVLGDITKIRFEEPGCTFVSLEVFEHLPSAEDLELLRQIPKGSRLIISVPSFNSKDHKRFFPYESSAIKYYEETIDVDFWRKIRIPTGGGYFHLMRGYR
ncbi:MAG TPA: class I SAM-dependent methyltransferase, partial [Methylomirabilota bacterium]|nr:class I SAM-dependent methyltransferase [Methylomirabilota bacterium]